LLAQTKLGCSFPFYEREINSLHYPYFGKKVNEGEPALLVGRIHKAMLLEWRDGIDGLQLFVWDSLLFWLACCSLDG
jgi:hypothetical protein